MVWCDLQALAWIFVFESHEEEQLGWSALCSIAMAHIVLASHSIFLHRNAWRWLERLRSKLESSELAL